MRRHALLLTVLAFVPLACNNAVNPPSLTVKADGSGAESMALVEGEKVTISGKNSKITFVGTKTDGKHEGGFKEFTGEIGLFKGAPGVNPKGVPGWVQLIKVEINADSIFSDDEKLTAHLKNEDFFNVKKHPTIKFVSTECKSIGDNMNESMVTGNLTLLGETKPISFPVKITKDKKLYLTAEFKFNRADFGMTFDGGGKINKEVTVKVVVGEAPKEAPKDEKKEEKKDDKK